MKKLRIPILIALTLLVTLNTSTIAQKEIMVMMHFDDGYRGVYENAFPLMEKYGFRGTVFMPTNLIDRYGHMYLDQLHHIKDAGWEIGSHTRTHPDLRTLNDDDLLDEIVGSRNFLEAKELLTLDTAYFCSPMTVWSSEIRQLVSNHYVASRAKELIIFGAQKQPHQHLQVILKETKVKNVQRWILEAQSDQALLILIFHEVAEGGNEYFFSPKKFEQVLQVLKESNVKVVTIEEALQEWGY